MTKILIDQNVVEQALGALENCGGLTARDARQRVASITALRAALAEPVQELADIPLEDALSKAYYYTEEGKWRGAKAREWDRWHAVAKVAAALTQKQAEPVQEPVAKLGYTRKIEDLIAQRDALLEALKKAEENGCATVYSNEYDECGAKGCCGVVSYAPHADDCWVTTARAAIKAVKGEKT
jgi:hypothetical protein